MYDITSLVFLFCRIMSRFVTPATEESSKAKSSKAKGGKEKDSIEKIVGLGNKQTQAPLSSS